MARTIKRLPSGAKYDYTDVCGFKHYHTAKRWYLTWRNKQGLVVKSMALSEEY